MPASRGLKSVQKETHHVDSISFDDVLEAFNPLNHIPIISEFSETQNPLMPLTKMAGSMLIGGPLGLAMSAVDVVSKEATGQTVLANVVDVITGEGENGDSAEALALAESAKARYASERYQSFANAHKRHLHTWST